MSDRTTIWRVTYERDAYEDQTGRRHWGYVVHEVVSVRLIGREPWTDPYTNEVLPHAVSVYVSLDGRVWQTIPAIDYCAVTRLRSLDTGDARWQFEPINKRGFVSPNGEPV